jgi:hypothetical protein
MMMTEKTFHLRANEVRAESRALMLKLRTERLGASRHKLKQAIAKPLVPKASAAVTNPKAVATSILASRKIQTAVKPVISAVADLHIALPVVTPPVVEVLSPDVTAIKASRPITAKKDKKAGTANVTAPTMPSSVAESASKPLQPKKAAIAKNKSRKSAQSTTAVIDKQAESAPAEVVLVSATAPQEAVRIEAKPLNEQAQKPIKSGCIIPLSALPALGPGMIWRLSQVGVQTLGDLAAIEADDLRKRLGAVAKLVRVENWIDQARLKVS